MKFPAFEPIDLNNSSISFESIELDLAIIIPDDKQARKKFDESSLDDLASSIKKYGVIQPVIVREVSGKLYQLIAGERRWRAARLAGLSKIPAIIRKYDKPDRMTVALIENIQRENLNPIEEAQAIQCLIEECSMTHYQVAESIGRSRTSVSNLLRLLNLQNDVKLLLNSGLLEMGHARALLSLPDEQQVQVANLITEKKLSVRESEKLVQNINNPKTKKKIVLPNSIEQRANEWKMKLSKILSSNVNMLFDSEGKGRVVIHFDSIEEADWLINHLTILKE